MPRFPFPEMPDWFETVPGRFTMPAVRIEDYLEDDCYVMRAELPDRPRRAPRGPAAGVGRANDLRSRNTPARLRTHWG